MAAARLLARLPNKLQLLPVSSETLARVQPAPPPFGDFKFVRNSVLNPNRSYSSQDHQLVLDEKEDIVQRLDIEIEYTLHRSPPHKVSYFLFLHHSLTFTLILIVFRVFRIG